jgi:hypothetical protein
LWVQVCHDKKVMNYSAYLRVYEPLSAFHEPDRSRWTAYAASGTRPRRRDALSAEHTHGLRWLVARPEEVVPEEESGHAYVRSSDGVVYICPWETRLRSVVAAGGVSGCRVSTPWIKRARPHIRSSNWSVPLAWFVPFAGAERWLALGEGPGGERERASRPPGCDGPEGAFPAGWGRDGEQRRMWGVRGAEPPGEHSPPQVGRTLVYVAQMSRARRRVARGLAALREMRLITEAVLDTETDLAAVGRWLEEFHPYSLVELDYGGLVYLLTDDAMYGDESVAELAAAIDGMSRGHCELAIAMYSRAHARWRTFKEFEQVN